MYRSVVLLTTFVLLIVFQSAYSQDLVSDPLNTSESSEADSRQFVEMPEQARKLMRQDMLDHLAALNEIITHLGSNDLEAAADVAESRMGISSMGKHRSTGMGPGRLMPLDMRKIGFAMHEAATEFSKMAKQGDLKSAYGALQKVTGSCVACHYSYRTR